MSTQPVYRADIERSIREEVRVTIEPARNRFNIDIRHWEDAKFGAVLAKSPTKRGVTLDARKIPELIIALEGAREYAAGLGLIDQ